MGPVSFDILAAAVTSRRPLLLAAVAVIVVGALAYLRDPPWLLQTESGFRGWESDEAGARFRWMNAHASFFVRSTATSVTIPLRTTFTGGDWPITVTVSIDDRLADRLELTDGAWHHSELRLPPPGGRRVRRIDIRASRSRPDDRTLRVGEIEVR
jgi:hypothetical protein